MKARVLAFAILATLAFVQPALAKSPHGHNNNHAQAAEEAPAASYNQNHDHTLLLNLFSDPSVKKSLKAKPSATLLKRLRSAGTLAPKQQAYFLPPGIAKKLPPTPAGTTRLIVEGQGLLVDVKTGALVLNLGKLF